MGSPTFGLVLPSSRGTGVPGREELLEVIEAAEDSPLTHLWVSDHILWWHPMHESLTLLAAVAARTSRVGIGAAVLLLAMRNPVIAAKQLATIARMAEGRLTVGVGIGGEFPPEWEATGVDLRTRARRTDESIEALRGLWDEGSFSYEGKYVVLRDVDLHPKPDPPPPIWVGGRSEAAVRRAGRLGDGWMGLFLTPDRYAERLGQLRKELEARARGAVSTSLYVWTSIADTAEEARRVAEETLGGFYNVPFERLERYAVVGSPEDCVRRFREFADAGVEHFAVAPVSAAPPSEFIERLSAEVVEVV